MLIVYIIYIISLLYLLYLSIKKNNSLQRFVVKLFNCSLFIVIFIVNYYSNKISYSLFIPMLIAFILSFLGDIALGFVHVKKNIVAQGIGFLLFSIAQIVFIYSFISNFGFNLYLLFIPVIGVMLGLFFIYHLKVKHIIVYPMTFIYLTLVTMMLASTLSICINSFNLFSIILLLGGVLFAISDYTLMFKYFDKKHKQQFTFISVLTYGLAQLLLATSILFL